MEPTTLYYFFSTVAQVLAGISALLAIFTQFKINEIKEFLVGDGKSTYNRMYNKEDGYDLKKNYKTYLDRLRDAIDRKSILGILEVIEKLADYEIELGRSLETNPRGLIFLKDQFNLRILRIKRIKNLTKKSIFIASLTILMSLVSLTFVECIVDSFYLSWGIILTTISLTIFTLIFTVQGVFAGFEEMEII